MEVWFYTKEGCPLCDEAEELLNSFSAGNALIIHRMDIRNDSEAYRKYWDMIPVIAFPGGKILWGRIEREDIESAL